MNPIDFLEYKVKPHANGLGRILQVIGYKNDDVLDRIITPNLSYESTLIITSIGWKSIGDKQYYKGYILAPNNDYPYLASWITEDAVFEGQVWYIWNGVYIDNPPKRVMKDNQLYMWSQFKELECHILKKYVNNVQE